MKKSGIFCQFISLPSFEEEASDAVSSPGLSLFTFQLKSVKMGERDIYKPGFAEFCLTLSEGTVDVQSTLGKIFNVWSPDARRARGIHITIANLTNQLNQLSQ